MLGGSDIEYDILDNDGVKVMLSGGQMRAFMIKLQGRLTGEELAGSRGLTLPRGRELTTSDLIRVMPLSQLIGKSQGEWLRQMIEENHYITWFQPLVDGRTGKIQAYEALFRGLEDGQIISPNHIFGTAKDGGMLFQVDLAARRSAVECASQQGLGDKTLFINFNPTSVYDPSYCLRTTVSACDALGLKPSNIVFEVTETEKVDDMDHLRGILAFYRKAGFRVALDDIGAGYSGLSLLRTLSPDLVKIDMELVSGIDQDEFKSSIVEHLIAIAHERDIQVVAEGIETEAEYQHLKAMDVDLMQGFYFARPAETMIRELSNPAL